MLTIRFAALSDVLVLKTLIHEFAEFEHLSVSITKETLDRDGFGPEPRFRVLLAEYVRPDARRRQLVGPCDPDLRLSFEHPGSGDAHVIILRNGSVDQLREHWILIHLPPLFIAKRRGLGG